VSARRFNRPWGAFWVIKDASDDRMGGYKVKLLKVAPGARLSDQMHLHRSEVWTVLQGRAKVKLGGLKHHIHMEVGSHLHIVERQSHRLANAGTGPLIVLEAQYGESLSESDIIRLSDDYGRAGSNGTSQVKLCPIKPGRHG
jgi:mannose-6-phosphate isomerase-like protein (cupin superfamily)